MNALRCLTAAFVVVALTAGVRAADNDNATLLVGTWTVTVPDPDSLPAGAVVVFDGSKVTLSYDDKDGKTQMVAGSYTVKDDQLNVTLKTDNGPLPLTFKIEAITATGLSALDEKSSKHVKFERTK